MLQPGWKKQKLTCRRGERDARPGAHPGQFGSRRFVHRNGWAARITKNDLAAFHIRWDLGVISGRDERSWMAVQNVGVSRTVHIDPPFKAEGIFLLVTLGPEVVEKSLNVLLHLITEFHDHRFFQVKEIECV